MQLLVNCAKHLSHQRPMFGAPTVRFSCAHIAITLNTIILGRRQVSNKIRDSIKESEFATNVKSKNAQLSAIFVSKFCVYHVVIVSTKKEPDRNISYTQSPQHQISLGLRN